MIYTTIYKNKDDIVYKFRPSSTINSIKSNGVDITDNCEIDYDNFTISSEYKNIEVIFSDDNDKFIDYRRGIFGYFENETLLDNSEYELTIIRDELENIESPHGTDTYFDKKNEKVFKFTTSFSPMHCTKKDVVTFIKHLVTDMEFDYEYLIFKESSDIDVDFKSLDILKKKKLCKLKVALYCVNQFYLRSVAMAGLYEDGLGSLKYKRDLKSANLADFIKMLEDLIDEITGGGGVGVSSFTKAKNAENPLETRLW